MDLRPHDRKSPGDIVEALVSAEPGELVSALRAGSDLLADLLCEAGAGPAAASIEAAIYLPNPLDDVTNLTAKASELKSRISLAARRPETSKGGASCRR